MSTVFFSTQISLFEDNDAVLELHEKADILFLFYSILLFKTHCF